MYGAPKERRLHRWRTMTMTPRMMPYRPKDAAKAIRPKRNIRIEIPTLNAGMTKFAMAVMATTMTIAGETMPASTAA